MFSGWVAAEGVSWIIWLKSFNLIRQANFHNLRNSTVKKFFSRNNRGLVVKESSGRKKKNKKHIHKEIVQQSGPRRIMCKHIRIQLSKY